MVLDDVRINLEDARRAEGRHRSCRGEGFAPGLEYHTAGSAEHAAHAFSTRRGARPRRNIERGIKQLRSKTSERKRDGKEPDGVDEA